MFAGSFTRSTVARCGAGRCDVHEVLIAAAVLAAMGCGRDRVPAPAHADSARSTVLARLLIEQLPALRSGSTLGEWKRAHPSDAITLYRPDAAEQSYQNWCARVAATLMLDSLSAASRTVYFYPPPVPDPPVLPTTLPRAAPLVDECELGFVWVEARVRDAARTAAITAANVEALSASLGAEEKDAPVTWASAAAWRDRHFWRRDTLQVVVASTDHAGWRPTAGDSATRLLVIAAGPASGIDLERIRPGAPPSPSWLEQQDHETTRLREAIALADAGAEFTEAMLSFVSRFPPELLYSHSFTEPEREEFDTLLVRWLASSGDLPVARRAAALLAADLFMTRFGWPGAVGGKERAPLRRRLEGYGAQFLYSPLGTVHVYTRSWVKEARRLDPNGAAGELAFLVLTETGFETRLCQEQNGLGFRAVIEQGEMFLRARPHAPIAADVHVMVAQAYADIVTLAAGGGGRYADSAEYVAEAPAARASAIDHYRAAFDGGANSFRTRRAWPTAWRLMAGLVPTSTFFFCIYD